MIMFYGAAAIFGLALIALNLVSIGTAMLRARPPRKPLASPSPAPAVSIVRPVCGLDNFYEDALGSSFCIDYPNYEVIFCIARAGDPAVPVVERLINTHPRVPAQLIIGDETISANPKLNNCVRGWDAARHDWIILSDANVLMPRDFVQRLLASWKKRTGLVCSMPIGSRPRNFWAELECAFLNTYEARWQYCAEALGMGFAQGKSMLCRRDIIEAGGGIRALASDIIEDAAATKLVRRQGLGVHLVGSPFEQPLGSRAFREVLMRQLRWARTRRKTFPLYFAPEIFACALLPAFALAVAAYGLGWNLIATLLVFALFWYGPELLLARANGWHQSWRMPLAFVLRDGLLPIIYIDAWCMNDFVWRGNAMTMRQEERELRPAEPLGTGFRLVRVRLSKSLDHGGPDLFARWRKGFSAGAAAWRERQHHERD
jgi:ceramide glucosyltransferase